MRITFGDWLEEAQRTHLSGIPVQIGKRSDEMLSLVVENVPRQPEAQATRSYGLDTYAYSFDTCRDESTTALDEIKRISESEFSPIYIRNAIRPHGGELTHEGRGYRGQSTTDALTLDRSQIEGMEVTTADRNQIINFVQARIRPRRVDPGAPEPNTISGMTLWLRADDLATTHLNGDPVSSWQDASGSGHNASASGTDRPTFVSNACGSSPAVRFVNASHNRMDVAALSGLVSANAYTVFVVFKAQTGGVTYPTILGDSTNNKWGPLWLAPVGTYFATISNDDGTPDYAIKACADDGSWRRGTFMHSGGNLYVGIDDTRTASLSSAASGNTASLTGMLTIGYNTSTNWWNSDIAEILIYNVALSEADRETVEQWLHSKYDTIAIPYDTGSVIYPDLFVLPSVISIPRAASQTVRVAYRDPDELGARAGGLGMVPPRPTTDYLFNTRADGLGSDITSQLTVTPTFGGNMAQLVFANAGPQDGYVTFARVRGLGVYSQDEMLLEASNATSIADYGKSAVLVELPYQSDEVVASDSAHYVLNHSRTDAITPTSVSFTANVSDALMVGALAEDIGSRIRVIDATLGVDGSFYIQNVKLRTIGGLLLVTWGIIPADLPPGKFDGSVKFDGVTHFAYGAWNRGW
jgi:hypothetical protein